MGCGQGAELPAQHLRQAAAPGGGGSPLCAGHILEDRQSEFPRGKVHPGGLRGLGEAGMQGGSDDTALQAGGADAPWGDAVRQPDQRGRHQRPVFGRPGSAGGRRLYHPHHPHRQGEHEIPLRHDGQLPVGGAVHCLYGRSGDQDGGVHRL